MNTVWLEDRSFAKLRHCELYYRFANKWLDGALGIDNVKLYVRGMDLLTVSKIKERDPEIMTAGYPAAKSIHIGCKLNF
jgi:hypothetical protein